LSCMQECCVVSERAERELGLKIDSFEEARVWTGSSNRGFSSSVFTSHFQSHIYLKNAHHSIPLVTL
jgi:hypothetical protein